MKTANIRIIGTQEKLENAKWEESIVKKNMIINIPNEEKYTIAQVLDGDTAHKTAANNTGMKYRHQFKYQLFHF